METNYDEDLSDNIFFQVLQTDHFELFQRATVEGWVICVPRLGSLPKYTLTPDDFFSHILIPSDELPETHFRSLNDIDIKISNRVVTVESGAASSSTHVLFEETFYTEDMLKYKVFCIENPLHYSENDNSESTIITVHTLRDCIDFLWSGSSGKDTLVQMDEAITVFLSRNNKLEYKKIDVQKDLVQNLYDQCLQMTLQNKTLHEKTFHNRHLFESVKISVESYVLHGIYKKLISGITACTASEDSDFNKIIRNLSDIQLKDLDIRLDLYDTIPMARRELTRIDGYSTVLGKVGCLKRTLAAISKQDSNSSQGNIVATDDLLPILIFLVIKSGLANWIAHLTFMKQFCFSYSSNYQVDQHSFLVTSLEAAIEHINSGSLLYSAPEAQLDYYNKNLYQNFEMQDLFKKSTSEETNSKIPKSVANFFECVRQGNVEKIIEILNQRKNEDVKDCELDACKYLCHPLCSCDKCEFQISMLVVNTNPTVHSCDERGSTALHIASIVGQPKVVDLLISLGSNVNAVDQSGATPLHYACSRGHKNELLLLLHSGAKIDKYDNEGNTPLHCAANNGHDGCVKAILYFSEQSCYKLDVNRRNNQGETALHNAARWGYKFIVKTLLDYGANPKVENKRKLTPIDYSHNLHVAQILTSAPRHSNLKLIIPQYKTEKHDIQVAASVQTRLDFTEESKLKTPKGRMLQVGDRPHTVDQIKKVERLLIAVTHGDIRLACFYLGLEGSLLLKHNCHPLCECKQKNKDEFGESKSSDVLNVNICNSDGFTPLHVAAMHGRVELTEILLKAGAYTNVQTKRGLTPLHLACQNQRIPIVQLLLDANCDINIQDCSGNSALHCACNTRNVRLVELLLKYKPNRILRNDEGRTVLEETEENMCLTLTRLLTEG